MCTFNFQAVNPWSLKSVLVLLALILGPFGQIWVFHKFGWVFHKFTENGEFYKVWFHTTTRGKNRDAWPEIERDGDCIVTACLSQVLSDIWSLSVIINNDIVIIIYHHHQNHHHQHQLDKTIRVARVTTVVSHSAIIILRWRWGRSLILLQRRISGNGDSSSPASIKEARTPDDASQEAKTTGREW